MGSPIRFPLPGRCPQAALSAAVALLAFVVLPLAGACVKANPPTDTSNPFGPSSTSTPLPSPGTALAYTPDMKPIFDADCVPCHGSSRPLGNYSMTTYADVMRDVIPGSASSRLVVTTQPGGSMYSFFSGDQATKANLVRSWVVDYKAAETR